MAENRSPPRSLRPRSCPRPRPVSHWLRFRPLGMGRVAFPSCPRTIPYTRSSRPPINIWRAPRSGQPVKRRRILPPGLILPALPADDPLYETAQAAAKYMRAAKAKATLRAYESDWRDFAAWCETNGLTSLPPPR